MVHRTERLVDVLCLLREFKLEPKQLNIIYPKLESQPVVFLVCAIKGGKKGLKVSKVNFTEDFNKSYQLFN